MAEVFLARRRAGGLEKELVVKRIRPERATDVVFLDLFVREARLSMALAHQNIVPVFDFGRAGDEVYFAMERVEGQDLGSSLAHAGAVPMPEVAAAFVAAECCQALDYAHHRAREGEPLGIVHRDVTPRNVLLSWSGEVKLTDFGIAALAGDDTHKLIGTPSYMAPEQARREPIDPRADVYGVGMLLREALTGARARPGDDRETILAGARIGELAPWPTGRALDPALVAIVDRATAARVDDRFPDARAMYAELDRYILAARTADPGEAPARQLARWLETVWREARDAPIGDAISGVELVSLFEDDRGSGTQRSLVATVGDDPEPSLPPPPPAPAPRARRGWIAIGAVGVIAIGAVVWRTTATPASAPPDASPRVAVAVVDVAPPIAVDDAALPPPPPPPPPIDAPIALIAIHRDAGAHPPPALDAAPAVAIVHREVLVGARPWATVTVDDDPTVHDTPAHLQLAVGLHALHFTNAELHVERTVPLDVPASGSPIRVVEDLRR